MSDDPYALSDYRSIAACLMAIAFVALVAVCVILEHPLTDDSYPIDSRAILPSEVPERGVPDWLLTRSFVSATFEP